jgi:hypothetical protein
LGGPTDRSGGAAGKNLSRLDLFLPIIPAREPVTRDAQLESRLRNPSLNPRPTPKMSVIIPQQTGRSTIVERPAAAYSSSGQLTAWRILGWLGLAFFIISLIDLALGWYPTNFGTPGWEFGTISASLAALGIPCLSLYLILGSAMALERPIVAKATGIVMVVLALLLPALGILYLTNVPLALRATATNDMANLGIKKSILKALTLFTGYEVLFVLGALKGLRRRPAAGRAPPPTE